MTDKQTIQAWVDGIEKDYISNYIKLGLKASGNWEKELESKIEESPGKWKITFLGASYTQQLVSGRRKNQNENNIRAFVGWAGSTFLADWVKNKGLNISPFAVAYKIARQGIKVPNSFNDGTLVDNVITDKKVELLLKDLLASKASEIRTDIKKTFNGNNRS
jgi:hypothetical protein